MKTGDLMGNDGVNQILPHKHPEFWGLFLKSMSNHWNPSEISMSSSIQDWRDKKRMSDDERLLVKRCLGFFAGAESLVSNNLLLSIFKYITDPEVRQYLTRQIAEEGTHNHTVVYVCDSLGLEVSEVYEAYKNIPSIKAKNQFLRNITSDISRSDFDNSTDDQKRELIRNILTFYIICEGIFFFSGFAMLLSFGRQGKLLGVAEQTNYTLRDETLHIEAGVLLLTKLRQQYPHLFTPEFDAETISHIKKAVELEIEYAKDVLPRGIIGLKAESFIAYTQFIANRRLVAIGLAPQYPNAKCPFEWLSETIEIEKQKNFFESKVISYQSAGNLKDDF